MIDYEALMLLNRNLRKGLLAVATWLLLSSPVVAQTAAAASDDRGRPLRAAQATQAASSAKPAASAASSGERGKWCVAQGGSCAAPGTTCCGGLLCVGGRNAVCMWKS